MKLKYKNIPEDKVELLYMLLITNETSKGLNPILHTHIPVIIIFRTPMTIESYCIFEYMHQHYSRHDHDW